MTNPMCPNCGNELIWKGVDLFCDTCSRGNSKSIAHFFKTLGADSITDTTVQNLGVKSIEQMYNIDEDYIMDIDGFGISKADKIVYEIQKTLLTTPEKLLAAFGMPSIGIDYAKIVLQNVKDFDEIFFLSEGETGLGPKTEEKFLGCIDTYNELWRFLVEKGITFKKTSSNDLRGFNFAITGTLPVKRDEVVRLIEDNGGIFNKSVSSKTNYLVVGESNRLNPTVKMKAAEAKGTKIIVWEELLEMV